MDKGEEERTSPQDKKGSERRKRQVNRRKQLARVSSQNIGF